MLDAYRIICLITIITSKESITYNSTIIPVIIKLWNQLIIPSTQME